MTRVSLIDELLSLAPKHAATDWFQRNAVACLELCDLFGQTARQHHDQLVARFIEVPAANLPDESLEGITASGPPLPVLLRALEILRDMRTAANRADISTRYTDLQRLRDYIAASSNNAAIERADVAAVPLRSI
jgi:monodechloroaminopyrrolnitrin synthase PrnB-like protein